MVISAAALVENSRMLHPRLPVFLRLMRFDRPIGTWLVLWPTLWALWLAAEGLPNFYILLVFVLGAILMRAAGCVINDYADRHLDGHVKRTEQRPLVQGLISEREALVLFFSLCIAAFCLVLITNWLTIGLSFIAVLLASCYPFMKRCTHLPQVVLGAAFAWAIPMAFAAEQEQVPFLVWPLYVSTLLWVVAYDTFYAMVDRDDDVKVGIKSTAILFGRYDRMITAALQILSLALWLWIGYFAQLNIFYYLGCLSVTALFIYQQWLIRHREGAQCFKAFLLNHWVGAALFVGISLSYLTG